MCVGLLASSCTDRATLGAHCRAPCAIPPDAGAATDPSCAQDGGCMDAGAWRTDGGLRCDLERAELPVRATEMVLLVDDDATGAPWWLAYRDGLDGFLRGPRAEGAAAGLMLAQASCEAGDYDSLTVPVGALPAHAGALMDAVPVAPLRNPSLLPGLAGALRAATERARAYPGREVRFVWLTGLSPGPCDAAAVDYTGAAATLLAEARTGEDAVATHVIGFGALIALAAPVLEGSTTLHHMTLAPTAQEVTDAMDDALDGAGPCSLDLPDGARVDPERHTVLLTGDAGETAVPILPDATACSGLGVYPATGGTGAPLLACPGTCGALATATSVAVSGLCRAP